MRRLWLLPFVLGAMAGCVSPQDDSAVAAPESDTVQRPVYPISLDDPFDPTEIPAYTREHAEVYQHIDANIDSHLASLQRWMRQRSMRPGRWR